MKMAEAATEKPIPTESSFMEGLRKTLTERDQEITDRVNEIDMELAKLQAERINLTHEQGRVQDGIKALK